MHRRIYNPTAVVHIRRLSGRSATDWKDVLIRFSTREPYTSWQDALFDAKAMNDLSVGYNET